MVAKVVNLESYRERRPTNRYRPASGEGQPSSASPPIRIGTYWHNELLRMYKNLTAYSALHDAILSGMNMGYSVDEAVKGIKFLLRRRPEADKFLRMLNELMINRLKGRRPRSVLDSLIATNYALDAAAQELRTERR